MDVAASRLHLWMERSQVWHHGRPLKRVARRCIGLATAWQKRRCNGPMPATARKQGAAAFSRPLPAVTRRERVLLVCAALQPCKPCVHVLQHVLSCVRSKLVRQAARTDRQCNWEGKVCGGAVL